MPTLAAIAVAVPVNNEAELLPSCLAGIRAAVDHVRDTHPQLEVMVCFALDRCRDDSATVIESFGYLWVESVRPGVGAARACAIAGAMAMLGAAPDRVLIACTDANSVVPLEWLTRLVLAADERAAVHVGPARPRRDDPMPITLRDGARAVA